jgi:hypothetical protein
MIKNFHLSSKSKAFTALDELTKHLYVAGVDLDEELTNPYFNTGVASDYGLNYYIYFEVPATYNTALIPTAFHGVQIRISRVSRVLNKRLGER